MAKSEVEGVMKMVAKSVNEVKGILPKSVQQRLWRIWVYTSVLHLRQILGREHVRDGGKKCGVLSKQRTSQMVWP